MREETELYLIWSNQHSSWWRPASRGYCMDVSKAGLYHKDVALGISFRGRDGWGNSCDIPDEIAVPLSCIPKGFAPKPQGDEQ